MAYKQTILQNLKTGKNYPVTPDTMEKLRERKMLGNYTIVSERIINEDEPRTTMIPPEISEASAAAADVLKDNK